MAIENIGSKLSGGLQDTGSIGTLILQKGTLFMAKFWVVLRIAIYIGIIGALCMAFYQFYLRYKHRAIIFLTSGTKIVQIRSDKALVYEDKSNGVKKIMLWRSYNGVRLCLPLVEGQFKYIGDGKKDTYMFWLDDNMQLQPSKFEIKPGDSILTKASKKANSFLGGIVDLDIASFDKGELAKIKPRPQDRDAWASMERQKQSDKIKKENPFMKYAQVIVPIAIVGICFLMFWFWIKEMGTMANSMAGALNAIAQNCLK